MRPALGGIAILPVVAPGNQEYLVNLTGRSQRLTANAAPERPYRRPGKIVARSIILSKRLTGLFLVGYHPCKLCLTTFLPMLSGANGHRG
jgi:hypothetical protein